MASLPPDFLLTPAPDATVTRIDFVSTPLPEYADLQAFVIDDALTSSECTMLLSAAEASDPWKRAMIQVGNGRQRQEQVRTFDLGFFRCGSADMGQSQIVCP